jgi:hypothetical protein
VGAQRCKLFFEGASARAADGVAPAWREPMGSGAEGPEAWRAPERRGARLASQPLAPNLHRARPQGPWTEDGFFEQLFAAYRLPPGALDGLPADLPPDDCSAQRALALLNSGVGGPAWDEEADK